MSAEGPQSVAPQASRTSIQATGSISPWSLRERMAMLFWELSWTIFCVWTPKPFNAWRLGWLKLFGAHVFGTPFVHQRARILIPWNLILLDRACLGDGANAYSLGKIEIGMRATVAQEAYLCTGTHDLSHPDLLLQVAKITIGEDAFVAARAFIMPGITVGARAVVGACAVVTRDVPADSVVAGNPARAIGQRNFARPECP